MFNAPPKIDPRRYQTKRQKLLVFAGIVLLSFIALISGLKLLGEIGAYLMGYRDMVEAGGLINSVVIITIVVVSVVGLLIFVPLFRRPLDTSSQLNYIPSKVQGQPFAVRFKRKTSGLFRRSFRGCQGQLTFGSCTLLMMARKRSEDSSTQSSGLLHVTRDC